MAIGSAPPRSRRSRATTPARAKRRRGGAWRVVVAVVAVLLILAAAAGAALFRWSGVALAGDTQALARVQVERFGGTVVSAQAHDSTGRTIPLSVAGGLLTPQARVSPGDKLDVDVVVRRPGWAAWVLGSKHSERLTVRTPAARVDGRYLTSRPDGVVRVRFDRPVESVAYGRPRHMRRRTLEKPLRSIPIGKRPAAGSVVVAAAPRSWERLAAPVRVRWFPRARVPVVLASPPPNTHVSPVTQLKLTFALPVAKVLGTTRPTVSPSTPGRWVEPDDHTIVFIPRGAGVPLGSDLRITLPRTVAASDTTGHLVSTGRTIGWTVPPGSFLRLQQLLAEGGYLPVDWTPTGAPVAHTPAAETAAAVHPPAGSFAWRYSNTPRELTSLWSEGQPNQIVRGAVMMFQSTHDLTVDGIAGPQLWNAVLADAIAGTRRDEGYSYVYVHRNVPQSLNLWHDGSVILTSPGNTGVPAAPTQLGTFAVFEHISSGTMSGTNPDGSRYKDPGIRWISYFNHGDAIHAFNRSSFGTPQSLGCVELPLASAAKVWPYTPIGTLVTIEN